MWNTNKEGGWDLYKEMTGDDDKFPLAPMGVLKIDHQGVGSELNFFTRIVIYIS